MVGLLHAIPKTPLYARLLKKNALDLADEHHFGHQRRFPKAMIAVKNYWQGYLRNECGCLRTGGLLRSFGSVVSCVTDFEFRALNIGLISNAWWHAPASKHFSLRRFFW